MVNSKQDYYYTAGINDPGYMPNNTPAAFLKIEDAYEYLIDELKFLKNNFEGLSDKEVTDIDKIIKAMNKMSEMEKVNDYFVAVGGKLQVYWVAKINETMPDDEEWTD